VTAGKHGIGVNTPIAAADAAATIGFAIDEHMPNGGMFMLGLLSIIFAAGAPALTLLLGNTESAAGAIPKLQVINAPETT
jgi:hypothetical protein